MNCLEDNMKWNGWMLTYVTCHCLTDCSVRQSKNNPFKLRQKSPHFWASQHLYEDFLGDVTIPTEFYYGSFDSLFTKHESCVVLHDTYFDPMIPLETEQQWGDYKHVVLV